MLDKIVSLAKQKGISQAALERRAGLPQHRISKWVQGQGQPSAAAALAIARLLDVSLDYLVDDDQDRPSTGLSRDDLTILRMARQLDPEEAIRRLMAPEKVVGEHLGRPIVPSVVTTIRPGAEAGGTAGRGSAPERNGGRKPG